MTKKTLRECHGLTEADKWRDNANSLSDEPKPYGTPRFAMALDKDMDDIDMRIRKIEDRLVRLEPLIRLLLPSEKK